MLLVSYQVAQLPWAHAATSLQHCINRYSHVIKMITTTQDAWVKSFIEELAITVVILDLLKFRASFFS